MRIHALLHTSDNRGDHAADIEIAHEVRDGETVEELVARVLVERGSHHYGDYIALRVAKED